MAAGGMAVHHDALLALAAETGALPKDKLNELAGRVARLAGEAQPGVQERAWLAVRMLTIACGLPRRALESAIIFLLPCSPLPLPVWSRVI